MTVNANPTRVDYDGNGSTDTFPYSFPVTQGSDLRVVIRDPEGIETEQTLDVDFTVELLTASSGNVVLTAGNLDTDYHLTILLDLAYTQPTAIRNQAAFYEEVHEKALDRNVLLVKQLQERVNRAIVLPATMEGADGEITGLTPGYALGINATGDGLTSVPNTGAEQSADLANTTTAGKGAGLIGFNSALSYAAGTVGRELLDLALNLSSGLTEVTMNYSRLCEGRLTLATGVPVTTTDQTAKTTVYFTPFKGNRVALYDGSSWVVTSFSEISVSSPSTTNTPFDVFVYSDSGTATLETVDWTNTTTRATALTLQDGVYVKSGDATRRYLGTGCTTGVSGELESSIAKRRLWNYYNRVAMHMAVLDATNSWAYSSATIRQARATATNQLDMVIGVSEDLVCATAAAYAANTTAGQQAYAAIGLDSTTTPATGCLMSPWTTPVTTMAGRSSADWVGFPGVGLHTLVWLEASSATGTTTFYGDGGNPSLWQSGICGIIMC